MVKKNCSEVQNAFFFNNEEIAFLRSLPCPLNSPKPWWHILTIIKEPLWGSQMTNPKIGASLLHAGWHVCCQQLVEETVCRIPTALGPPTQLYETWGESFSLQYKDLRTKLLWVLRQLESLTHTTMAKINVTDNTKCWQRGRATGTPVSW